MSLKNSADRPSMPGRDQLLTIGDLEAFKQELLVEIRSLLKEIPVQGKKQWLRSSEVRRMLGVSAGTLQNLRVNGVLTYTKVGTILLYKYDDIVHILESNSSAK